MVSCTLIINYAVLLFQYFDNSIPCTIEIIIISKLTNGTIEIKVSFLLDMYKMLSKNNEINVVDILNRYILSSFSLSLVNA